MGFYLLHESMLNSVIFARDKFLKDSGIMFPDTAQIYSGVVSMDKYYEEKIDYWKDVYGFNFSSIIPSATQGAIVGNAVVDIEEEQLISTSFLIENIDLTTVTMKDLAKLEQECFFSITKDANFHAFCIWFDVGFPNTNNNNEEFILSTAPDVPQTHWKQFVLKMPEPIAVTEGTSIEAVFTFSQDNENPRFYNVSSQLTNISEPMEDDMDEGGVFVLPGHEERCDCVKCKIARAFVAEHDNTSD
mmetsp:Transcript_11299/g.19324  ORF Transcript_11299/g.19324 Transcript_11299/m.19324 type:complete len:245 (+) Transcript_11299:3-737(+)